MALGMLYSYTQSQLFLNFGRVYSILRVDQNQFSLFVQLSSCIIRLYYHGQTDPIKQTVAVCFVHLDSAIGCITPNYIFPTAY